MPYEQMKEYHSRGIKESVNILMAMHCGPMLRGLRNEVILSCCTTSKDFAGIFRKKRL